MKLSKFGKQLTADSGIVNLMEDLGDAINVNPDLLFMGGGNPARIPEFEKIIAQQLKNIANSPAALHKLIGTYQSPRGSEELIEALVKFFNKECGWPVTSKNIALANGSQSAFFILINMFAGNAAQLSTLNVNKSVGVDSLGNNPGNSSGNRKICFPIMPEYLGYSDQGVMENIAVGCKPRIEYQPDNFFKYRLDEKVVESRENVAAYCVSRPTNPSGNMLSAAEMASLCDIAKRKDSYLLVDCAYGNPFPGIVYDQVESFWHDRNITVMSLSKLGLPGTRTGIVVAADDVIDKFCQINTIISLANGNLGPTLLTELINSGSLPNICKTIVCDHYRKQREFALAQVKEKFRGINYKIHQPEGAFFLWLWFEGLSITTTELYQRLKAKSVIVMPGEHFFFGMEENWDHSKQCVRITYCQEEKVLEKAIGIMAQELENL